MRKVAISGALVTVAVVAGAANVATPQLMTTDTARYEFSERFRRPPTAACSGAVRSPVCGEVVFFNERLATPPHAAAVDVVVTLTAQYRTSVRDGGRFFAEIAPRRRGPYRTVAPGAYRVSAAARMPDTTTMSWEVQGLEAAGRSYNFALVMGSRGMPSWIELQKMTAVIDMTPAGPTGEL